MASAKDLYVNVVARTKQLTGPLRQAGAEVRAFGTGVQGTAKQSSAAMGQIGTAAKAFVGVQGARAIYDAALAAGALEDSIKGTARVFGDSAGIIGDAAEDSAKQWGIAEAEFRQMSTNIGLMLKNYGFEADEAAEATVRLADRAVDMAANAGLPMASALDAIGAALRGERDSIEKFGVSIKQVDIDARLAADGLVDLTGEAKKAAEAQAAIAIIFDQSTDSVGAFEESATASLQRFRAQLTEVEAQLGESFLPVLEDTAESVGLLELPIDLVAASMRSLLNPANANAAAMEVLNKWYWGTKDGADDMSSSIAEAARMARLAVQPTTDYAGAVADAGTTLARARLEVLSFGQTLSAAASSMFGFRRSQTSAGRAIERVNELLAGGTRATGGAAAATRDLTAESEALAEATQDVADAETDLNDLREKWTTDHPKNMADAGEKSERAQLSSRDAALDLADAEDDLNETRKDAGSSQRDIERAEIRVARAVNKVEDATDSASTATREWEQTTWATVEASDEYTKAEENLEAAQQRLEDQQTKTTAAISSGGGAAAGAAVSFFDLDEAMGDAVGTMGEAAAEMAGIKEEGDLTTATFGLWKDKIEELADGIAPGSPLRLYLDEYIAQIEELARVQINPPPSYVPPPITNTNPNDRRGGPTDDDTVPKIIEVKVVMPNGQVLAEVVAEANLNSGGVYVNGT